MSKEEPRWKAGLRGSLEALAESAFERGPGLTEAGVEIILPHIRDAEQRGFQAGVNKTGDSVGKLRARLNAVRELHENVQWHCGTCADEYGSAAPWPCPTARALESPDSP